MELTNRKRMETVLSFREADRVPIEVQVTPSVRNYPGAQKLVELVDKYADNFNSLNTIDWGFYGIPSVKKQKVTLKTDEYTSTLHTFDTPNGAFSGIKKNANINPSYWHWEKNFIENVNDLARFANSIFPEVQYKPSYLKELDAICGEKYTPMIAIHHPFGNLARMSPPEEFYIWLCTEKELIHKLFRKQYDQINSFINKLKAPFMFSFCAFELAIEPWMSREMFDEFIYCYDVEMNANIHKHGGKVRHHAHGPVFKHLSHWSDMGVDSIEPLETPPYGDTDLAEAKKMFGNRISLAGNIPSQRFIELKNDEIELMVKDAIKVAASGGGFILRGASLVCGLNSYKNKEQLNKIISATECFIKSGLMFGKY